MTPRRRALLGPAVVLCVVVGLTPASPAAAQAPPEPTGVQVAAIVETPSGRYAVRRSRAAGVSEGRALAARWRTEPGVVDAGVDSEVRAYADPEQAGQWGLTATRATEAWSTGPVSGQVVAVVDSGVDLDHPDLAPQLLAGYDAVDGDAVPDDVNGHGTHVAGIVGAVVGNGVGGAGVARDVRVLPVRVLGADGRGDASAVAAGIRWAADRGASVVNLSLGSATSSSMIANAVSYALGKGITVVAATGNEGVSSPSYPAAQPGVVAVGAVDQSGAVPAFSNRGGHVALVGPGVDVVSTLPGGQYGRLSGTSMAAPFVAGAAAVVRAHRGLTGGDVVTALTATATDLGPAGRDDASGHGRVDVVRATGLTPIGLKHAALGGDRGWVGPATSPEAPVARGRAQEFTGATIWWSPATGAAEVHGSVLNTYRRLGASAGPLGLPVTDERGTPDGRGRYNHFEAGSIYWSPATASREVRGSIRATWSRLGWERSALGYPTTDELGTPDGRGRYNHFETGSVYWTPSTGAREVRGSIRATWSRLGWERSALGYPTTDELGTPDGRGRYNHFEHGSVYFTPTTGAHEVRGAIRSHWASLGWERSSLGYPVSDEYAVPGGRATDFERGRIRWDATTGALSVSPR